MKRGCLPKLQSEAAVHVSHNGPTAPSTPRTPKSTPRRANAPRLHGVGAKLSRCRNSTVLLHGVLHVECVVECEFECSNSTVHSTVPCIRRCASLLRTCRAQPGCEDKIRSAADALAFCLMNDLDAVVQLGTTTATTAAQICENPSLLCLAVHVHMHILDTCSWPCRAGCGVFGRDEGGSDFSFSAQHIETL